MAARKCNAYSSCRAQIVRSLATAAVHSITKCFSRLKIHAKALLIPIPPLHDIYTPYPGVPQPLMYAHVDLNRSANVYFGHGPDQMCIFKSM
jgi:hypothetical protein